MTSRTLNRTVAKTQDVNRQRRTLAFRIVLIGLSLGLLGTLFFYHKLGRTYYALALQAYNKEFSTDLHVI